MALSRGMIALIVLPAACDRAPEPAAAPAVRDSSGVRIVVNDSTPASPPGSWRIDADPAVRIGGGGSEAGGGAASELHRVSVALRVDGLIVVADAGSGEIRWFDGAGSHVRTAGGPGEGPGEFRSLSWIGRGADSSIHAWDPRLRRLSTFRDGELVDEFHPNLPDHAYPLVHGVLGDGRVVASPGAIYVPEDEPGVQRPPMPVWLIDPASGAMDTIGPFPGQAVNLRPSADGGWIRTVVPFGPGSLVGAGPGVVVVGETATYEVRYFSGDGSLVRIARVRHDGRPVTERDLRAELERRLAGVPPVEEIRAGIRSSYEQTPPPAEMPAFDAMVVDRTGHTWVRREAGGGSGDPSRWDVLDPDGVLVATLVTPAGLRITDIGSEYVLGVWTDELGVEHVQLHRLVRR